jgi:hypothetical protein
MTAEEGTDDAVAKEVANADDGISWCRMAAAEPNG